MGTAQCRCLRGYEKEIVEDDIDAKSQVDEEDIASLDISAKRPGEPLQEPQTFLPAEALSNSRPQDELRKPPEEDDNAQPAESRARELLKSLRIFEAAAHLEEQAEGSQTPGSTEFREALDMQLRALGTALQRLAGHPGLREQLSPGTDDLPAPVSSETFLGVPVPASPASLHSSPCKGSSSCFKVKGAKQDILNVNFDLDDHGRRVEATVEFFQDGAISIEWAAFELPIAMPYVLCLVHEVDLLGEVVPFIVNSSVLHQFPWNEADRLIRVVSKPPIPFVSGLEGVAQRFGFDLLDTPWQAFCLVEQGPEWESRGAVGEQWRHVPRPAPFQKGLRQVDVKSVVALGQPVGPEGKLTTILFSATGRVKVPRSLLPDWLVTWLVKTTGRFIYQHALERVASFDSTKFGSRLQDSSFYAELHRRIARFADSRPTSAG